MNVIVKLFEINQDYNSYWNWGEALFSSSPNFPPISLRNKYYNKQDLL